MSEKWIMIIDDDLDMCRLLEMDLTRRGFKVIYFDEPSKAIERLRQNPVFVAILTDVKMKKMTGLEFCRFVRKHYPDIPVFVMSAFGTFDDAVEALRLGAFDFISKPIDLDILARRLEHAIRNAELQSEVKRLRSSLQSYALNDTLIGESPPMKQLRNQIGQISELRVSILIQGETGSGKEVVAKSLHENSPRRDAPFVSINCAAIPDGLLESELFGHVKGAFTGASRGRLGLFKQADGGTLFLDEIGELSISLQAKVLRALEDRRVKPLGSDEEVHTDIRIVSASNQDLLNAVECGTFRADLYYRINVCQLTLPPLRERGTDVLLLANHFIDRFAKEMKKELAGLSDNAAMALLNYSWPGNVRELRNAMERAVALTRHDQVRADNLSHRILDSDRTYVPKEGFSLKGRLISLRDVENLYSAYVLDKLKGNKMATAKILGIDRKTLYRKLSSPT